MKKDEVQDLIIKQSKQLQLPRSKLSVCLAERARDREPKTDVHEEGKSPVHQTQEPPLVKETQEFVIGNKLEIRNPDPFQADRGVTIKIGNSGIAAQTELGSNILPRTKEPHPE